MAPGASRKKTCFVITPYGDPEGTDEQKEHAKVIDGLIENVLRPVERVCLEAGLAIQIVEGRDRKQEKGIWNKIGSDIESAETVIAVIYTSSPNAYLELGLAYGLWMSPILIVLDGAEKPSDLKDIEHVAVSRAEALREDGADPTPKSKEIAERIVGINRRGRRSKPDFLPETTTSYGSIRTYDRFSKAIEMSDWSHMMNEAEKHLVLVLPKGMKIRTRKFSDRHGAPAHIDEIITEKVLGDGVDVTVVTNHPDRISDQYLKMEGYASIDDFRDELARSFRAWNTLREGIEEQQRLAERRGFKPSGSFRLIRSEQRQLPFRATLTERRLLLTMRFSQEPLDSHHCIDAPARSAEDDYDIPVYQLVSQEIDRLVRNNVEQSERDFEEWLTGRAA